MMSHTQQSIRRLAAKATGQQPTSNSNEPFLESTFCESFCDSKKKKHVGSCPAVLTPYLFIDRFSKS